MPVMPQSIPINFGKGLDLKTDPYQLQIGSFLELENSVFTTSGRLSKRNGFQNLTELPNNTSTTLTTLNDNLIATGTKLYAFSEDTDQWLNQGIVQPVQLSVLPLIRVSTSQSGQDSATAPNGLTCLAYVDNAQAYYIVSDSTTGQQIVQRTILPAGALSPRVFVLGYTFVITFLVGASLRCVAVPIANPNSPSSAITIAGLASSSSGYDGATMIVSSVPTLYLAWGASGSVQIAYTTPSLAFSTPVTIAGTSANLMSVITDPIAQNVYMSYWDGTSVYAASVNYVLSPVMSSTLVSTVDIAEITSVYMNSVLNIFYEVINTYAYDTSIRTDYIQTVTVTPPVTTGPGTVGTVTTILRSVGLASKAFTQYTYYYNSAPTTIITAITLPTHAPTTNPTYTIVSQTTYMMVAYGDTHQSTPSDDSNQPTYFLIDSAGNIYLRLAYSNGGGYVQGQVLPSVSYQNSTYFISYLNNDFLATVNKGTNLPTGTPANAIYTQTGVNLARFTLNTTGQLSSEIASSLHLTGGMLWQYDGVKPVEHNFHVWPENVEVTTSGSGGDIGAGTYYYQFTYEWTDNAGNLHRSAPSIPVSIVTTGSTSTNTIDVPTARLTFKQPYLPPSNVLVTNPIRIVGYRWSVAQQVYYQFTSLTAPIKNDTTIDYVTITDTLSDASILGNTLLYTTGGVIEDIAAPASIGSALFDTRLWLLDAEDPNLLWYSKQVIENVPVEMSDLLTFYVAPTTSAQGSTGSLTALYPMDDKLILFKKDAIYYINGTGPDNTGSNNQYSQPIFITAAVGTSNPQSIVLTPNGLMFQSDKGIWLLGRDLSTTYIGAPVEAFNSLSVMSATAIPATTQVRFVTSDNITLMYDYYFQQWGTHTNIEAISSTLYQGAHTYLNTQGQIYQETPGVYTDGAEPVLMNLTTSWINLAGLQGFERFKFMYLLGTYFSPFQLNVSFAYDYNNSPSQNVLVLPQKYTPNWGNEAVWGSGGPWGGPEQGVTDNNQANVFSSRVFPEKQKCSAFQMSIQEVYDPSVGPAAGQGLALSGMNLIVGAKRGWRTQGAGHSFG